MFPENKDTVVIEPEDKMMIGLLASLPLEKQILVEGFILGIDALAHTLKTQAV